MPVTQIPLDSSLQDDDVVLLLGKYVVLKRIEDKDRSIRLANPEVRNFLQIEDLWTDSMRGKMRALYDLEERTRSMLERLAFYRRPFIPTKRKLTRYALRFFRRQEFEDLSRDEMKKQKKEVGKILEEAKPMLKREYDATRRSILHNDKRMLKTESSILKKYPDSHVLHPTVLLFCPKCYSPLIKVTEDAEGYRVGEVQVGEVKGMQLCRFCLEEFDRTKALRANIHEILPSIHSIWESNKWFEEQVAKSLRRLNWQTWVGVYVLGTSGISHEVDILGIRDGTIVCAECKTGKIRREHVFNFWTKMADTRSHIGLFASVEPIPEPETRRFLTGNPAVVCMEEMGKLSKKEVGDFLEKSILGPSA